ncbi:pentapeptide repeat-containing protein [Microcoleus sp. FACHB-68]|uniref:pentapeptide repeat-containing protein n=1 Tax=Microcoleus sp. FACHB-68 TaxID=2692826 RepID=UPI0016895487|nr:pentapeptide repeat-containing protein [Microcoleus sp. FACHB-68]MBD1935772.1 pentapeptide repeat-containing protein [Microcoleus sp. FACHB-68]
MSRTMKLTMGEFNRRYQAGERDFTRVSILDADFRFQGIPRDIILKKANLTGALLEELMIPPIDMSYAKFKKARLGKTVFCGTNLEGADFRGAHFCQTYFSKCNLRHANFSKTVLTEILFKEVDLSYANFSGAAQFSPLGYKGVIFHETIMPDGSLYSNNPTDNS